MKAAPDLVRIRLVVQQIKPSPQKAFEAGQANVADLRGVLRGHHIPDAAVSASRLRLNSEWQGYGKEREFLGYKCEASFTIESENLDGLQQLLIDVVNGGVDRVDEVEFDVRAKAELRAQARRAAVQAARAKALLYADAAGVQLGSVLHIQDVDPESVGNERYRGHGSGGATAEEDLAPGHVVVSAAVVLGFALADQ